MLNSANDIRNWKIEQINYFKKYLYTFSKKSKEFQLLKKGIEELESSLSK